MSGAGIGDKTPPPESVGKAPLVLRAVEHDGAPNLRRRDGRLGRSRKRAVRTAVVACSASTSLIASPWAREALLPAIAGVPRVIQDHDLTRQPAEMWRPSLIASPVIGRPSGSGPRGG